MVQLKIVNFAFFELCKNMDMGEKKFDIDLETN